MESDIGLAPFEGVVPWSNADVQALLNSVKNDETFDRSAWELSRKEFMVSLGTRNGFEFVIHHDRYIINQIDSD